MPRTYLFTLPLVILLCACASAAPMYTPTRLPSASPSATPTLTASPSPEPSPTPTPKPDWMTAIEIQDPEGSYYKEVNGQPVIDLYETKDRQENISLNQESIRIMTTADGLNPNILTARDTDGNQYAFNPDHGWFMVPAEVQMDYAKLGEYTEVEQSFIEDGRANITSAIKYAGSPTISPDAIDPVYWIGYNAYSPVPTLCLNACGLRIGNYGYYPEELAKMRYDSNTKPFAWTGYYKVQLDNGETIYTVSRTLKNPTETNKDQLINLFYGFDKKTYEGLTTGLRGSPGWSSFRLIYEQTNDGLYDFLTILAPPEPYSFDPNRKYLMGGGPNPVVGNLQKPGQLISLFDQVYQQNIVKLINLQFNNTDVFPLAQPLPVGLLSKSILFTTFINT